MWLPFPPCAAIVKNALLVHQYAMFEVTFLAWRKALITISVSTPPPCWSLSARLLFSIIYHHCWNFTTNCFCYIICSVLFERATQQKIIFSIHTIYFNHVPFPETFTLFCIKKRAYFFNLMSFETRNFKLSLFCYGIQFLFFSACIITF